MSHPPQESVTRLLEAVRGGDQDALNALFPLVYDELHRLAQHRRRHWQGNYTLNTTALVHEAYLKLADQSHANWASRAHFFGVAARAMRHILINYAKQQRAQKRGGHVQKLSLDEVRQPSARGFALSEERADALVSLDEALGRLAGLNERQSRIVECRFFGGMTIEDTAAALDLSPATVKRGWSLAQAWLYREMHRDREAPPGKPVPG